jgi:hypothetical protein
VHGKHALDFDQETVVNHEVGAKAMLEPSILVDERSADFALKWDPSVLELDRQASRIGRLEQPGTEDTVHFNRRGNNLIRQFWKLRDHNANLSKSPAN